VFFGAGVALISKLPTRLNLADFLFRERPRRQRGRPAARRRRQRRDGRACSSVFYRSILLETFDPVFHRATGGRGGLVHLGFLTLTVLNLVAAMQTMGIVLALGLFLLPAVSAYLWCDRFVRRCCCSRSGSPMPARASASCSASTPGLASGAAIVLCLGAVFVVSALFSPRYGAVRALRQGGAAARDMKAPAARTSRSASRRASHRRRAEAGARSGWRPSTPSSRRSRARSAGARAGGGPRRSPASIRTRSTPRRPTCGSGRRRRRPGVGLNLEPYLDRLVGERRPEGRVVSVGDLLPSVISVPGAGRPLGEGPPLVAQHRQHDLAAAEIVRREFTGSGRPSADAFAAQRAGVQAPAPALKEWAVIAEVARLPPRRRQLVTSHDAFGYFAHDYGFTIHAISGLSTESEADARNLAGLIDLIRRERIGAVFAGAARIRGLSRIWCARRASDWAARSTPTAWGRREAARKPMNPCTGTTSASIVDALSAR
jgi:hypothetical protein